MVTRHLMDSLSVMPWIDQGPVLDAGTGAGLPGIPLAIMRPELQLVLLDSSGKKVRFLRHAARQLKLSNIQPVQARLESWSSEEMPAPDHQSGVLGAGCFCACFQASGRCDNETTRDEREIPGF